MGKTVVVYQTKYGTTKKYAEFIAEQTGAELIAQKDAKMKNILAYDNVVFGGCIFITSIKGLAFVKNGFGKLKSKKLVVFSVGSTPIEQEAIEKVRQKNFSSAMIDDGLPLIHLPGTIDVEKLSSVHRAVMVPIKNIIDKKAPEDMTDEDRDFLAIFSRPAGDIDKAAAMAVVEAIGE